MKKEAPAFLGVKLDEKTTDEFSARYVISLISYEKTTTYRKGTSKAPEAIVAASQHVELFDEILEINASTFGIATIRPGVKDLRSITAHARDLKKKHGSSLLAFLGGEHSVTPAIIEGLGGEMGIVWLDAHSDLRKAYMGSSDNHACAARNCLHLGKIVQIGVRSLAEEEFNFLKNSNRVARFKRWSKDAEEKILALPDKIYLTVDVDGLDPTLIRAVGTPEPGGLGWEEVLSVVDFICRKKELVAFDLVELCPSPEDVTSDYTAARLVYKVISHHAFHKQKR